MNIPGRPFTGHYDDIENHEWIARNGFGERYIDLNTTEHLTELERKELDILARGTEEEYLTFLREHGDKKKS